LGSSFYSFLFPPVPLVPTIPTDVSEAGRSAARDAQLFPSDEELSQRTIWIALLICLGWSVLALGGALPLYIVSTPCLAQSANQGTTTGAYSVVHDLSLLRLLELFDMRTTSTTTVVRSLHSRAIHLINSKARIRTIVLTVLVIVVGLIPALWKVLSEFSALVAYRRRWVEVRCEGQEMGWLSASKAPGFVGWGEQRLKEYILKMGLSSTLDIPVEDQSGRRDRRRRHTVGADDEKGTEVDVQTLFSVG
jgi:calcium permeable stress-gated cation channel